VLKECLLLKHIDELTVSILRRSINKFSEKAAMAEILKVRAVIGNYDVLTTELVDGKTKIKIPVDRVNIAFVQKTYLLVENLADAKFYKLLNEGTDLGRIPIDFEAYPGGGNTTGEALSYISTLNRMCLCIVDSDVRYSGGPLGETAKKVVSASKKIIPSLTAFYVLPVSSVENLIPMETLIAVAKDDHVQVSRIKSLEPIYTDIAWPYFGLKRGIRCSDIVNLDHPSKLFWGQFSEENINLKSCTLEQCVVKKCANFIYPSLGSDTLNKTVSFLEKEKKFSNTSNIATIHKAWGELSEHITAWCCSGAPVFSG